MCVETIKAQLKVAEILKDLEVATGRAVEEVMITRWETTMLESKQRTWRRAVAIKMHPKPGDHWST